MDVHQEFSKADLSKEQNSEAEMKTNLNPVVKQGSLHAFEIHTSTRDRLGGIGYRLNVECTVQVCPSPPTKAMRTRKAVSTPPRSCKFVVFRTHPTFVREIVIPILGLV